MQDNNELPTEKRKSYSPAETAMIRFQTVGEIVSAQTRMMEKAPDKVSLNDLPALKEAAKDFMKNCAENGILPSMLLFAAAIGHSRRNVYDFVDRHRDSETALFLDRLRALWAGMRISAVDRGAAAESLSIFLLKNSGQGLTDSREIEIHPPESPLEQMDTQSARQRLIEAIPFDGDDQ